MRFIILIIFLSIVLKTQASLLIPHDNQTNTLLFGKNDVLQPTTKIKSKKTQSIKSVAVTPIQAYKRQKPKSELRTNLIQNEINEEIRSMNKDIIQYNKLKDTGNIKEALSILESIIDRKKTIKILQKEKHYK